MMETFDLNRRGLLSVGALLGAASIAGGNAVAEIATASAVAPQPSFSPLALPFDPKTVTGLSEALLTSHYENNYKGAVMRLEAITQQFAALDIASAPGFTLNGLKREELVAWNSMILHELYFVGLGPPTQPGAELAAAIARDFGSAERWRAEFSAMGKALGGGSGWVLLTWSHRDKRLTNQWAADHTMSLAGATPLLALDMYEHAYAIDYGAKAAAYVEAFMAAINFSAADVLFAKVSTD
jgi:Fe-Mn family superoxide dismutase